MLILSLLACRIEVGNQAQTQGPSEGPVELWVYTSMYQSVLDELDPMLAEELPGVQVKWFQSGSEKVAQRLEAEWAAGGSDACVLMTSDPFWYQALSERGALRPYVSPQALALDRQWVNPRGFLNIALVPLGHRVGKRIGNHSENRGEKKQQGHADKQAFLSYKRLHIYTH